jgi:2-polyprenyl-3-methyl-5-hydroxy-6-metoxy-1,4-benzoquinol methylase
MPGLIRRLKGGDFEKDVAVGYLRDGFRVLDFGCGRGAFIDFVRQSGKICEMLGVDNDEIALKAAESRGYTTFRSLDEVSGKFDLVAMLEVAEDLSPSGLSCALDKIHGLLKPGGIIVLSSPNPRCIFQAMYFWDTATHVRPYSRDLLTQQLRSRGFEIIYSTGAKYCLHPMRILTALMTGSDLNTRNILVARKNAH